MAMDLKRVALGLYRGSQRMAETFQEEVRKRRKELDAQSTDAYLKKLITRIDAWMEEVDSCRKAEDALMYSTLLQNYVQQRLI